MMRCVGLFAPPRRGLARWYLVVLLVLGSAGDASGQPAPASQPASRPGKVPVKVVRVRDLLEDAIGRYQASDFTGARQLLDEVIGYVGTERTRLAQQAYAYRAFVHLAFDEREQAVAAFERALEINTELDLPPASPKIRRAFEQARRRHRDKIRALDHDPPTLQHAPPKSGTYGRPLSIEARATDPSGVKRVVLHFRQQGNRGFSSVNMERRGQDGQYVASLPTMVVAHPGVEYYIAAWDNLGNGPGLKGSTGAPIRIEVQGRPPAAADAGPKPWYKRWWVWATVAGVAAVTGAVVAGVYFTRPEQGQGIAIMGPEANPK
jgi:hypothetical protein